MKFAWIGLCTLGWAALAHAGLDDRLPPEAYINPLDQQIAKTGKGVPGRPYPCSYEHETAGMKAIASTPTKLCVKMLPEQRWRGLWRNDFEGSRFCPEPAKTCDGNGPGDDIWLSQTPGEPRGGLYWLDLMGWRTMYKGPYGHMGMSDQELVIDRMISMKEIEAPAPPPTEAEMKADWEKCEAAGNCISWEKLRQMQKEKK